MCITFVGSRRLMCVISVGSRRLMYITLQAFEDGPDRGFRNVGQYKPDAGDTPKN
jgi:hypothetical protein